MKRFIAVWVGILLVCLSLIGCGGDGGGDSSAAQELVGTQAQNPPPVDGGTTPPTVTPPSGTAPLGALGELTDLGDLLAFTDNPPPGDHWYFTKAVGINDNGIVIGQSNRGFVPGPVKGAFSWDPATERMTFLGIHHSPFIVPNFSGTFDDFFNIGFEREPDPRKGFIYSEAVDINGSGVIIGNSTTGVGWPEDQEKRAFLWKDGVFTDLTPPPFTVEGPAFDINGDPIPGQTALYTVTGKYSAAVDINEKGEVVLTTDDKFGRHAYFWNGVDSDPVTLEFFDDNGPTGPVLIQAPRLKLLGRIVGADSEAVAINENGQAVINSEDTAVFHDLHHPDYEVGEVLNHLPGATRTVAVDINDSAFTNNDGNPDGHIIGNSGNGTLEIGEDASVRGFFWDGGAMYPVDSLGGGTSVATDLNNKDQVVGAATLADGSFHAILWTLDANKKGVIRDLGTLGGANSFATAINEAGQVTGWSETGQFYEEQGVVVPIRHAFLWDQGIMFDLGTHNDFYVYPFIPSFPFSEAVALNASGKVAGNSITINEHYRGFYLSPVFP